jgi:hypothetical protein
MNEKKRLKKILLLIMIALIISMPVTLSQKVEPITYSKMPLLKKIYLPTEVNDFFDGNLSGWFGTKNEDGSFNILGDIEGHYASQIRFFVCTFNYSEGLISNDIIGFYNDKFIIGWSLTIFNHKGQIGGGAPLFGTCQINTNTNELEGLIIRPLKFNIYIYWQFIEFEE